MTRRGFLAALLATPVVASVAALVTRDQSAMPKAHVLTYKGVPLRFDPHAASNTIYFVDPRAYRAYTVTHA